MKVTLAIPEAGGHPVVTGIEIPPQERDIAVGFLDFAGLRAERLHKLYLGRAPEYPDAYDPGIAANTAAALVVCDSVSVEDMELDPREPLVLHNERARAAYPQLLLGMREMAQEQASRRLIGRNRAYARILESYLGLIENKTT